jgi:phosphate-selective porin OprO/OprP
MHDYTVLSEDNALKLSVGDFKNGAEVRRARFFNSGTVYSNVNYKLQVDFAGGVTNFKDASIGLTKIHIVGNIRVGQFKKPFRLEVLISNNYLTFAERSPAVAFSPERNSGILLHSVELDGKLNWQLGAYRAANATGDDRNAGRNLVVAGRVAYIFPLNEEEKDDLLQIAAAYNVRNPEISTYSISSRPESRLGPKYLSTGTIENVDLVNQIGLDLALVKGPFSAQAEYMGSHLSLDQSSSLSDYNFDGYYAQVSYFIIGESQKYKHKSPCEGFDRVKPKRNFGEQGAGAWEVAIRYSSADWSKTRT